MLTITRRINESIRIDDEIEVKVLRVRGKQVRLGINAPRAIEIHREEIYQRIQNEIKLHQAREAKKVSNM